MWRRPRKESDDKNGLKYMQCWFMAMLCVGISKSFDVFGSFTFFTEGSLVERPNTLGRKFVHVRYI